MFLWLAEISSLSHLDVSVPDMREKKLANFLTALDLAEVRDRSATFFSPSNDKYTQIFRTAEEMTCAKSALSTTFFVDYQRISLEKLEAKMDINRMRRFLKHLRNYIYYVRKYFYPVQYCFVSGVLQSVEDRCVFDFEESLKLELARRLIKILFDNRYPDSSIIVELFHTVCVSWKVHANLLLCIEPKITEYLLLHLTRSGYDARNYWMHHLFPMYEVQHLVRLRPKNFLVLLNYGLINIYTPVGNLWLIGYSYWMSVCDEGSTHPYTGVIRHPFLPKVRNKHTQRDIFILEVFEMFFEFINRCTYMTFTPETLRILWRSIPEAYISFDEMRSVLLKDTISREFVENICDQFEEHEFDGFQAISEPRSLQHLSRYAIRSALILSSQLPDGIGKLGLPSLLQSYLRLEF